MTLAQRKAARMNKVATNDSVVGNNESASSIQNVTVEEAIKMTAPTSPEQPKAAATAGSQQERSNPLAGATLSAQDILELAAKHGLKLQSPKKEYVKHTYSVTVESKALFKKYCDVLGINMQDAMEEAMQDFFKKHGLEYTRVKQAKNS
jgi:hypothetical protein